jgi:hypothetical protein
MANKLSNVSILTIGEAKGHNLLIDQKSLEQALEVANSMKRIKVTMGHGAEVSGILGYIDGFRIEGERLMGDLTLFNTNEAQFVQHLAQVLPEGFGLSLTFSGVPEEIAGDRFARVDEIFDISVVSSPAANSAGLFSAFCAVDIKKLQMNEASVEVKKEEIAPAVVAEVAAPAVEAPVVEVKAELAEMPSDKPSDKPEEKMAEPTLTDIAGMLAELLALMKADATQDVTEAPETPAEDMAKKEMPSEMSAKSDEKVLTTLEKAKADAAGAVAVPAESSQPLGRAEILNQFNAEKSPARRSELLRKLGL